MTVKPLRNEVDRILEPEVQHRLDEVVLVGQRFFEGTNIIGNEVRQLQESDVDRIIQFLLEADPPNVDNIGRHEHIRTTIQFADKLAARLGKDRILMKVLAALHDAGSVISQKAMIHDDLWKIAAQRIGIRQDIMDLLHSPEDARQALKLKTDIVLTYDEEAIDIQLAETPDEKKLLVLADIAGKRFPMKLPPLEDGGESVEEWDIITWEHSIARHIRTGEQLQKEGNSNYRLYEIDTIRYQKIKEWAEEKGIDLREIRNEIKAEEAAAVPDTVMIDMGNVAMVNPNQEIYHNFAEALEWTIPEVEEVMQLTAEGFDIGRKTETKFWRLIEIAIGKNPNFLKELLVQPLRKERNPVINRLIQQLSDKGYQIGAWTDTVIPHKRIMEEYMFAGMNCIVASCDTHVTKTSNPKMAAKIAAAIAGYKAHQQIVLIDDNEGILQAMKEFGVKTVHYNIQTSETSAPEYLAQGLATHGILVNL